MLASRSCNENGNRTVGKCFVDANSVLGYVCVFISFAGLFVCLHSKGTQIF